eukprot:c22430_g1_i1 orf=3-671(-)
MGEVNFLEGGHTRPRTVACGLPLELTDQEKKKKSSATFHIQANATIQKTQDVIDWDSLSTEQALALLEQTSTPPSFNSLIGILQKCRRKKSLVYAKHAHAYVRKNKMDSHKMLGNYLVPMFVDCSGLHDAQQVFDRLGHPNEFSWSSLIHGYTESGDFQWALSLYEKMQECRVHPSTHTFLSLLKACARLKSVKRGWEIHNLIVALGCEQDNLIGNTLVDMYA